MRPPQHTGRTQRPPTLTNIVESWLSGMDLGHIMFIWNTCKSALAHAIHSNKMKYMYKRGLLNPEHSPNEPTLYQMVPQTQKGSNCRQCTAITSMSEWDLRFEEESGITDGIAPGFRFLLGERAPSKSVAYSDDFRFPAIMDGWRLLECPAAAAECLAGCCILPTSAPWDVSARLARTDDDSDGEERAPPRGATNGCCSAKADGGHSSCTWGRWKGTGVMCW